MDTRHQWSILVEWRGQGYVLLFELALGIGQVKLIEHTMIPVFSQRTPVQFAEGLTLVEESMQVCLSANLLG